MSRNACHSDGSGRQIGGDLQGFASSLSRARSLFYPSPSQPPKWPRHSHLVRQTFQTSFLDLSHEADKQLRLRGRSHHPQLQRFHPHHFATPLRSFTQPAASFPQEIMSYSLSRQPTIFSSLSSSASPTAYTTLPSPPSKTPTSLHPSTTSSPFSPEQKIS